MVVSLQPFNCLLQVTSLVVALRACVLDCAALSIKVNNTLIYHSTSTSSKSNAIITLFTLINHKANKTMKRTMTSPFVPRSRKNESIFLISLVYLERHMNFILRCLFFADDSIRHNFTIHGA